MPLVHLGDMLQHAHTHRYAVGAFAVVSLDFITGIIAAAEAQQAPVILSLAESCFDQYDVELLMPAVQQAAQRSAVPVAIQLDRGSSLPSAVRAINLGCTGVMVDTSDLSPEENIRRTREVVEMCRGCGIPVEGTPGPIPGLAGADPRSAAAEAQAYLEATGVDSLLLPTGTTNGDATDRTEPDLEGLAAINRTLQIPLAIHDASGLRDEQYRRLIDHGVARISSHAALADAAGRSILERGQETGTSGYRALTEGIAEAVQQEAARRIKRWGGSGKAAELLAHCRPWRPVEHVILYNTQGLDADGVNEMMAEGHRVLSTIPGVLEVFTGHAVQEDAGYRHCWVIRFSHRSVIDSYRDHPDHQRFADHHFRPYAGGRTSIDFEDSRADT